jgi:hypothetical protein
MKIETPSLSRSMARTRLRVWTRWIRQSGEHIMPGGVFKPLFDIVFQDNPVKLPKDIEFSRWMRPSSM